MVHGEQTFKGGQKQGETSKLNILQFVVVVVTITKSRFLISYFCFHLQNHELFSLEA